jgi:SOS-response transcriptional repressor LexA
VALYEAKMVHHFNHRFGDYRLKPSDYGKSDLPTPDDAALGDPGYMPLPRYWVAEAEVEERLHGQWAHTWLLGWRNVCRNTDVRTVIAAVFPRAAVGHSMPVLLPRHASPSLIACLLANLCAMILDYSARQKVGGMNLTYGYLEQFPVLPPGTYERRAAWLPELSILDWIRPRVLELVYTAHDLEPFARDLGYHGPPFHWDPQRRFQIRSELDAAFFHLYGIGRDDVEYIMDTFPIVRDSDERTYGIYRTKLAILKAYDQLDHARRAAARGPVTETVTVGETDESGKDVSVPEPFERVEPRRDERHKVAIPLVRLDIAAGSFDEDQLPEPTGWVRPHTSTPLAKGLFVARVRGRSMVPDIPDGAWCLFKHIWTTPPTGAIVVAQRHEGSDPELGGRYTVKKFRRRVEEASDGARQVTTILEPVNPAFAHIPLGPEDRVVAQLVEVLRPRSS